MNYRESKLEFFENWADVTHRFGNLLKNSLAIRDQVLEVPYGVFSNQYPVSAGETLKDLEQFPKHVLRIVELINQAGTSTPLFIGLGGGSITDFTGFFASTYRRGSPYINIPSTWLAALDSAHGGKTALNASGLKNQIGTFFLPEQVWIIRSLLKSQPIENAQQALGELFKIAIIDGGHWIADLRLPTTSPVTWIEKTLPAAIEAKLSIVRRDFNEESGVRQNLNLGHTLGHVLEGFHGIPHGTAVGLGLQFSLAWSRQLKLISDSAYQLLSQFLTPLPTKESLGLPKISEASLIQYLVADKKLVKNSNSSHPNLRFIYIQNFGEVLNLSTSIESIVIEARRQGFIE